LICLAHVLELARESEGEMVYIG